MCFWYWPRNAATFKPNIFINSSVPFPRSWSHLAKYFFVTVFFLSNIFFSAFWFYFKMKRGLTMIAQEFYSTFFSSTTTTSFVSKKRAGSGLEPILSPFIYEKPLNLLILSTNFLSTNFLLRHLLSPHLLSPNFCPWNYDSDSTEDIAVYDDIIP